MSAQLIILFVLTLIVQTVTTGAFAARLAGVRTGHPSLAGSLYNVLNLVSRGANALAGPLVASLTDVSVTQQDTGSLLALYRVMLLSASAGTVLAAFLLPTLSRVLERGVASYAQRRSLPRVVVNATSVQGVWKIRHELAAPRMGVLQEMRRSPFPKRFLLAVVLNTAIATVSHAAALYASVLVPEGARTAASLSPMLAGAGLFLTIFVVTPIAAVVMDEALQGQRPVKDVTYITVWQIGAQLLGTVVAQLLLVPAGQVIALVTRWLI